MPRFVSIRNILRGPKIPIVEVEPTWECDPFAMDGDSFIPPPEIPAVWEDGFTKPPPSPRHDFGPTAPKRSEVPLASLHARQGLISLAEARRTSGIVYHSINSISQPSSELPKSPESPSCDLLMMPVPPAVDTGRRDIKYRREDFKMMEARMRIAAVRAGYL
ncbi:uncharacterized protein PHACADRAFT_95461 [Phanerochaete carnosa HHB-10118-sp]|uniref:Uncharacterized protein n=1 Tax=Phanerochaete carnosa (strain HHB-10118-sp) TaxID=650164 RepID=K5W9I1_PHACS|nr:uncharacterized protein PHACADRAFT_95461 [Phanerochaete carnosa HHB-10118-sp]EKM55835.1 hypothetical protein PHACADRAFT_95461 [Phanerochaete carnosa HHB-10118-sp]